MHKSKYYITAILYRKYTIRTSYLSTPYNERVSENKTVELTKPYYSSNYIGLLGSSKFQNFRKCYGAIRMSYNYLNLETPNACCSYHDGVAYRDISGNYVCNDGVINYTCKR